MGAELNGLLDVGGARGARDQVDGARHAARRAARKLRPGVLEVTEDPRGLQNHDLVVGDEVVGGRALGRGEQHEGAGLGDRREGGVTDRVSSIPARS
jgi:hypothetical protein